MIVSEGSFPALVDTGHGNKLVTIMTGPAGDRCRYRPIICNYLCEKISHFHINCDKMFRWFLALGGLRARSLTFL